MNIKPIITDFDDQDMYKFTMMYAVFKKYPNAVVEWSFFNRGKHQFPEGFGEELKKQVEYFKNIRFTPEIEKYFRKTFKNVDGTPYFDETFYTFLRGFTYDTDELTIHQIGSELIIKFYGYWHKVIMWETQLMPIISELYYIMTGLKNDAWLDEKRNEHDSDKIMSFLTTGAKVADFGTRRRFSKDNQERMLKTFIKVAPQNLVGTSNVMFARKLNIKPIGTMAHEWIMYHAAKYGVNSANKLMMENWSDVYKGSLGTVLTDTFTTDNFLDNFDIFNSKLYDGVRHDSGDPFEFATKIVDHYKTKGINPNHKFIVFSDGINKTSLIRDLKQHCDNLGIGCSFGIGTWLTNDVGVKPLNIVIKMTQAKPHNKDWRYCVKISDTKGKYTYTDKETLDQYLRDLGIKN